MSTCDQPLSSGSSWGAPGPGPAAWGCTLGEVGLVGAALDTVLLGPALVLALLLSLLPCFFFRTIVAKVDSKVTKIGYTPS